MQVSIQTVEANVDGKDIAGGQQFQRQSTGQRVVGEVEVLQSGEVPKRQRKVPFKAP
jgi:hypothetical protein